MNCGLSIRSFVGFFIEECAKLVDNQSITPPSLFNLLIINCLRVDYGFTFFNRDTENGALSAMRDFCQDGKNRFIRSFLAIAAFVGRNPILGGEISTTIYTDVCIGDAKKI